MAKRKSRKRKSVRRTSRSKGLGQLKSGLGRDLLPPTIGAALTAGTTLAVRAFVTPTPGDVTSKLYKWAPLLGVAAGGLGAAAVYVLGGKNQALSTGLVSALVGGSHLAMEMVHVDKPGSFAALSEPMTGSTAGLGAVVPEYGDQYRGLPKGSRRNGMGAIVMEELDAVPDSSAGETVSLGNVRQNAFGYQPYSA